MSPRRNFRIDFHVEPILDTGRSLDFDPGGLIKGSRHEDLAIAGQLEEGPRDVERKMAVAVTVDAAKV